MARDRDLVRVLLDRYGRTYAQDAGIRLTDSPGPLYQLLVLVTLLSAPIQAAVGLAAARELFAAGYRSPQAMLRASWQDRVNALGRGHYRRYDERAATLLGESARRCLERWKGDLRRLHAEADGDAGRLHRLLDELPGIGPTGADIYLREVQAVWRDIRPFLDRRTSAGARLLHLPSSPDALPALVDGEDVPRLASALVRVSHDRTAAAELARTAAPMR